jgi:glycosyltransferase involved in cell wall biosynthesis
MSNNKRLLIVAYHFPPVQGSTGVTRTLAFAKYLREFGWDVTVLTALPIAYPEAREENLKQIPDYVRVTRALAFDTKRHLSLFGRYPGWLATPDRWRTWYWPAVRRGMSVIEEWQPHAIMSTYPIATAHQIGCELARRSGLPWIADMRDPMAQNGYPEDPRIHRAFEKIEQQIFERAARVLVTTQGAAKLYRDRFTNFRAENVVLIPNGFDAEMFPTAAPPLRTSENASPANLLHSGLLYPSERDPTAFFAAVSDLHVAGRISASTVQFNFRATGHDALYRPQLETLGIQDLVRLLPAVPYRDALAEMQSADGVMLFQASNCNDQIPAKLYEYLYAQKPIFGLTDPTGETAQLMDSLGAGLIANLHDKESIKRAIPDFLDRLRARSIPIASVSQVGQFSRRSLTGSLAKLLDAVVSAPIQG